MPDNNPQQQTRVQQQMQRAAEGASRAAERLEQTADHATSVAIDKVRQAREQAQSGLEQQREQVVNRVRRVSSVLRNGSQTLSLDDPLSQHIFEVAGDSVERIADYIGNVSPSELANDLQSFARRRPGLFFGGTFILGLALGRFAKSTGASESSRGALEREDREDLDLDLDVETPAYGSAATSASYGARSPTSAPPAQPRSPSPTPRGVDDGEGTKS